MDEKEPVIYDGEVTEEPVCELAPETPLPDLSETTRYTDEYLAFLAALENLERNTEAVEDGTEDVKDSTETFEDSAEPVENYENSDNE